MAIATVKLAPIDLDRRRHLRMDFNALAVAEEIAGKSFIAKGAWDNIGARDVRALLYGCLKHEDASLTLEAVGGMLHTGNIGEVMAALKSVIDEAMPEPAEDGAAGDGEGEEPGKAETISIT